MAEAYILEVHSIQGFAQPIELAVQNSINTVNVSLFKSILSGAHSLGSESKNVNELIENWKSKQSNAHIEQTIREQKLKEAARVRQELQDRLNAVNENINTLADTVAVEAAEKDSPKKFDDIHPPFVDRQAKEEHLNKEKVRTNQAKEFSKQMARERKERARKRKEDQRAEYERVLATVKEQEEQRAQYEEAAKEARLKRAANSLSQFEHRRLSEGQRQVMGKRDLNRVKSQKPMYKVMEENYKQNVAMPELEKRKAELAAKREGYANIDHDGINDHGQRYMESLKERERRRRKQLDQRNMDTNLNAAANHYASKFTYDVLGQEKQQQEEAQIKSNARRVLKAKQERYAQIVREMFIPTVDQVKVMELQLIQERQAPKLLLKHTSERQLLRNSGEPASAPSSNPASTRNASVRNTLYKPRKFKPNLMAPPAKPPMPPPKVVDYLAQRRSDRAESDHVDNIVNKSAKINFENDLRNTNLSKKEVVNRVQAKTKAIESKVRRHELILSETNPSAPESIAAEATVNDLLIDSIKAKLALLTSVHK